MLPSSRWQRALLWIFHLLFFLTPLLFTWINEELFEFPKMIAVYLAAAIAGCIWLAHMVWEKKVIWRRTIFDIPIGLFLLSQIVSTVFSLHLHTSLFGYYTRFHGGLFSTLSYIILFGAFVTYVQRKDISSLRWSLFLSAIFVSAMAIPEHFGHAFSCLLINSNRQLSGIGGNFSLLNLWQNYNVQCWVQDVQNRVYASFGQPNWLAAYAITLIPLSISTFWERLTVPAPITAKKTEIRWVNAIGWAAISVGLLWSVLFTKSRSGFLGLIIGLLFFVGSAILLYVQQKSDTPLQQKNLPFAQPKVLAGMIGLLAVLLGSILWFGSPYTPAFSSFFSNTSTTTELSDTTPAAPVANRLEEGGTDSGEIRKIVWTGALKIWLKYPLFGSGVETFAYSYFRERPIEHNLVSEWDFLYNKAHNEFLNFLATTGAFGLLTYMLMLGSFIGVPLWLAYHHAAYGDVIVAEENNAKKTSKVVASHKYAASVITKKKGEVKPQEATSFSLSLLAISSGLIALSISNFFGFSTVMVALLLFLLPAFALVITEQYSWQDIVERKKSASLFVTSPLKLLQKNKQAPQLDFVSVVFLAVVALIGITLLLKIWSYWQADVEFAAGKQYAGAGEFQPSLNALDKAVALNPDEAYFLDELGLLYGSVAQSLAQSGDATGAAKIADLAVATAQRTVSLNPVHPNYYKSLTRVYLNLALYDSKYLEDAEAALIAGTALAPTDAKLRYNLALIRDGLGKEQDALADLEQAVTMKTNYEDARMTLAEWYEKKNRFADARAQYQYILDKIQPNNEKAAEKLKTLPLQNGAATPSAQKKK